MKKEKIMKSGYTGDDKMCEHLNKAVEVLQEHGYRPGEELIYIGYYGAHNYNLNDEKSDYDFKAIVIPSLKQMIKREAISYTIENEWGNIDVKDLYTYAQIVSKGNFSYLEGIQSRFWLDFTYRKAPIMKKFFANAKVNYMSMVGAIYEKYHAFTHAFPSKAEEFAKFECDPKQFQAAVRLYDILVKRHDLIIDNTASDNSIENMAFIQYEDDDCIDLSSFENRIIPPSRPYVFTREDMIKMKRELLMPLPETLTLFGCLQESAKELLPLNKELLPLNDAGLYKFEPNDYTDAAIDYLTNHYTTIFKKKGT